MARLVWLKDEILKSANDEIENTERESWEPEPSLIPNLQVYHYHNDQLGTPNELTNDSGEVVWLADYEAWGNTAKVVYKEVRLGQIKVSVDELQPIRFQGQSFDTETGLHYNRFRYYDPDLGMFISRDPIGLMGGSNVFQYAPNPTGWVDPFGLKKITVYHFTDEKSYNSITNSKDILIRASKPKASGNPTAVYVTTRSPDDLGHQIAPKLSISKDKTQFVISFEIDESRVVGLGKNEKNKFYIKGDVRIPEGQWKAGPVLKNGTSRTALYCKC